LGEYFAFRTVIITRILKSCFNSFQIFIYKYILFCGTKPKCENPHIMRPPLAAGHSPTHCSRWFYSIALRQLQNMNEGFLLAMPICQAWFSTDKLVSSQRVETKHKT